MSDSCTTMYKGRANRLVLGGADLAHPRHHFHDADGAAWSRFHWLSNGKKGTSSFPRYPSTISSFAHTYVTLRRHLLTNRTKAANCAPTRWGFSLSFSSQLLLAEQRQDRSLELHGFDAGMGRDHSLGRHDKVSGKVPRNGRHARLLLQILVDEGSVRSVHVDLAHDLEFHALFLGKGLDLVRRVGFLLACTSYSRHSGWNISQTSAWCQLSWGETARKRTKLIARKGQNVHRLTLNMTV
jgi:hypothetical protein